MDDGRAPQEKERKIIQIAFDPTFGLHEGSGTCEGDIFALCNDGTIWIRVREKDGKMGWSQIETEDIPQP